ncbi:conserved hypothetical protein [Burkholderia pseudomallei Pakistan 9]|nr:conserved hypothetical protein [Burkholderia pseudomallei Pakistan 9]
MFRRRLSSICRRPPARRRRAASAEAAGKSTIDELQRQIQARELT